MIYDVAGNEIAATSTPLPTIKAKRIDLIPAPGYVIVLRNKVETSVNGIDKPLATIELEERFNNRAQVARVGENTDEYKAWFKKGDEVIVSQHALTEVEIGGGDSLWIAPFVAIKAVFVEAD